MKFKILSARDEYGRKQPCEKAYLIKKGITEEEYYLKCKADEDGDFYDELFNEWEIEIKSVEELYQLSKDIDHRLIIGEDCDTKKPYIMIYDSYIE